MYKHQGYLAGKLLVAMPNMQDTRFQQAVVLICVHNEEGAMGLVLNKPLTSLKFEDLLQQLNMSFHNDYPRMPVHFGGPVESGRGFVIHSGDYQKESTLKITEGINITATLDILQAMAQGIGPHDCLLVLGYAGWGPKQLEQEIQNNGWLVISPDKEIIFDEPLEQKWQKSLAKIGVDAAMISSEFGHA